jgi:hypothetical protein
MRTLTKVLLLIKVYTMYLKGSAILFLILYLVWGRRELSQSPCHFPPQIKEFLLLKILKNPALKIKIILLIEKMFIKKFLMFNKKTKAQTFLIIKLKIMLMILGSQIHIEVK